MARYRYENVVEEKDQAGLGVVVSPQPTLKTGEGAQQWILHCDSAPFVSD